MVMGRPLRPCNCAGPGPWETDSQPLQGGDGARLRGHAGHEVGGQPQLPQAGQPCHAGGQALEQV